MKARETENPQVPMVPKIRRRVKLRKLVHVVVRTRNQRQVQKLRNLHRRITLTSLTRTILCLMMAGVMMNGTMTGARADGSKDGNKHTVIPHAHSHWEGLTWVQ